MTMDPTQRQALAVRVSTVTLVGNVALTALKLAAGLIAHSGAMLSDAAHSASDIVSTIVVLFGVRISGKESDEEHPYGHERMECVAAICLAALLFLTGLSIGGGALRSVVNGMGGTLAPPGVLALAAAMVSILSKELMYRYTRRTALRISSTSLMADAWHHRSDALSSIGSLVGIGGAILGFPIMDPLASLVISALILKVAADIARQAFDQMLDRACPPALQAALREVVARQEGVLAVDSLTTRQFGARYYVDVAIACDGGRTITEGHDIAHTVHERIEEAFPDVKHCMVHVNPYRGGQPSSKDYTP